MAAHVRFVKTIRATTAVEMEGRSIAGAIPAWWPLILVLGLQALVALTTLRNTAFQDEGLYLFAGRQILRHWTGGPAPLEQYAFYFSGYPYFYPVLGGLLDKLGGLELARAFSLGCMLGVTAIIYVCTQKLFGRIAATFGAATYGSLGTVLFVSRLATFDALCLLLVAIATLLALHVGAARRPWLALAIGPLLVLAFLAKYAALIFAPPILGLLLFGTVAFQGWQRMPARILLALATLGASGALTYRFMDRLAFHAINGSTTDRVSEVQKPALDLVLHVLYQGGIVYAAALVGLIILFHRRSRFRLTALVLFGASWLMPLYHIYKQEAVSLDKHMAFSLFFAVPLAGYTIAWLAGDLQGMVETARQAMVGTGRRGYSVAGVAMILTVLILGLQQSQTIYSSWANTSQLNYVLHTQMRDGSGRYLVEDIEVVRYDAEDVAEPWQWNGTRFFYYVDSNHRQLLGDAALEQAIDDRYFALVELSFIYQPDTAYFIAQKMAESRNYDLIASVPFRNSFGTGYYNIWRAALVAHEGNFTSLAQVGL